MLLVAVAATPTLLEVAEATVPVRRARHRQLTTLLHQYGVLTFRSEADYDAFLGAIRKIPDSEVKTYWTHLLRFGRQAIIEPPGPAPLDVMRNEEDLRPWADWVRLAVVSPELAQALGCSEDDLSVVLFEEANSLEITPHSITDSVAFTEATTEFSRLPVEPAWDRDELARFVLIPVIQFASSIVVHDRYLGQALFRERGEERRFARSAGESGEAGEARDSREDSWVEGEVEWLLRVINRYADDAAEVILLTTYREDARKEGRAMLGALEPILDRVWARGAKGLKSVALRILPVKGADVFGVEFMSAHDRCIQVTYPRFDGQAAVPAGETTSFLEFSAGLGRLGRPLNFKTDTYSITFTPSRLVDVSNYHRALGTRVGEDFARSKLVADFEPSDFTARS